MAFSALSLLRPHVLLLDEVRHTLFLLARSGTYHPPQPTNHLDIEGLDALMSALNKWNGGVIIISHDERFITSVAKEVRHYSPSSTAALIVITLALGLWRRVCDEVQRRRRGIQGKQTLLLTRSESNVWQLQKLIVGGLKAKP